MAMFDPGNKAMEINTLSVSVLAEGEKLQKGEIDRFKGCSHSPSTLTPSMPSCKQLVRFAERLTSSPCGTSRTGAHRARFAP